MLARTVSSVYAVNNALTESYERMGAPFDFEWPRDESGYEILEVPEEVPSPEATLLTGRLAGTFIRPRGGVVRKYRWLDHHPALFREFADTPQTSEGVLDFANRFGLLFPDGAFEKQRDGSEYLPDWFKHIQSFQAGIGFAEHGQRGWDFAPAQFEVQVTKNVSVHLVKRDERELPQLAMRPRSLIAAMWLQYGLWISTPNMKLRRCVYCSTWFTYGPGTGRRETARYCSPKCQKAHQYAKKKELGR